MKNLKRITAALFMTTLFFSCDKVDELTEIDVDGNFTTTIPVAVTEAENGGPQTFTQSATINIADDPDVQANLSSVEAITINSLTYEFTNYSGAEGAIVTNASIAFGNTTVALEDLNIEELDNGNVVFNLTNTSNLNAIGAALLNTPILNIIVSGTIDESPATFSVIVVMNATITVDAI